VIVGAEAPEVAAVDIDGKPFRLSKLRGKIVVLIFAQSVSDDYAKMYAPVRQLAAKYETTPVRFVGIMSNDDRANLDAAAKRGDLPWTVLPQPLNGPLQLDWGIKGYPSVYIVDEKGILQPELHMPYYGAGGYDTKDIDDKLEELVRRLAVKKQNSLNSGEPGVNKTEPTSGIETAVSSASQKDSPIGVFNRYSRMIEQRNWKEVLACMTEDCRDEEILERLAGIHLLSLYAKPTEEQVKNNTNPTRFRSAGFLKELEQQFPGFTKANANQDSTDRKLQEKLKSLDPAERRQAKLSLVRKNAGVDRDKLFSSLIDFMSRLDGSDLNGQQKSKLVDFDVRGEDASAVIVADDNGERKPVAFKKTTSGWKLDNLNDDSVMDKMAAMHREVEGINRTILDSGLQQMREAGVPEEEIKKFEQEAWQEMKQATEPPSSASD
jgi:peroxiredoxin